MKLLRWIDEHDLGCFVGLGLIVGPAYFLKLPCLQRGDGAEWLEVVGRAIGVPALATDLVQAARESFLMVALGRGVDVTLNAEVWVAAKTRLGGVVVPPTSVPADWYHGTPLGA